MKNEIVHIDAPAPLTSGAKFYFDTGNVNVTYEGEGADRVKVTTPVLDVIEFGPPGDSKYKGTAAQYLAACQAQAVGLLAKPAQSGETVSANMAVKEAAPVETAPTDPAPSVG